MAGPGWGRALVLCAGLLAACRDERLGPEMVVQHVASELAPASWAAAVAAEPAPGAVRRGVLQPGDASGPGAPRDGVLAPPPSRVRFRVTVPPDAVLRFSRGVESDKQRDRGRSAVEFRVAVDGRAVDVASVNPSARRRDRRWLDGVVDLRAWSGLTVDLDFETRAVHAGRPLAGQPGWSHVRVLREERRPRQPAGAGPSVLLLLVDTLRADRVGVYGASPSPTPALDAFAARGLVFEQMVAQSSWTLPSVSSILTGLHPRSHGTVGSDGVRGDAGAGGTLLADAVVTLAERAQGAGVTTMGVSTNMLIGRATNLTQGFEEFVELPLDARAGDYAPATAVHEAFLRWLDRAGDVRFLAYLHYMEPHGPYGRPGGPHRSRAPAGMRADLAAGKIDDFARKANAGRVPKPGPAEVAHLRALYDEDVRRWDDAFAALVRDLDARGVLRRTVIVVVADHGEEFLEHGRLIHGAHLYEETVRVPLVLVGPGIPAGRRADQAQHIDLAPTLAALLGAPPPAELPGRDLLATRDGRDAVSEIVSGFGDDGAGVGTAALRGERWKLIRRGGGGIELYDLPADPAERHDVAAGAAETAAMGARLDAWEAAAPKLPRADGADPAMRERLRQLGYVE